MKCQKNSVSVIRHLPKNNLKDPVTQKKKYSNLIGKSFERKKKKSAVDLKNNKFLFSIVFTCTISAFANRSEKIIFKAATRLFL